MVLADSHEISRVPRYSGTTPTRPATGPLTRLSRSTVSHPRLFNSQQQHARPPGRRIRHGPTTPNTQRPPPLTRIWFSLLRFRSPLLTEYLFLRVLRCPALLGHHTHTPCHRSAYTTLTLYGQPSQTVQLPATTRATPRQKDPTWPHNTKHATAAASHTHLV